MTPRFLADEDFRHDIVHAARRLDPKIDVVTVQQLELQGSSDDEVLEFALQYGRILVSHDVNTLTDAAIGRLKRGEPIGGVLLAAQSSDRRKVAEALAIISQASEAEEWRDVIDFIPW